MMSANLRFRAPARAGRISSQGAAAALERSLPLRASAQLGVLAIIVAVYAGITTAAPSLQRSFPTVTDLAVAAAHVMTSTSFWSAAGVTLQAAGLGLLISLIAGSVIGVVLSLHRNAYRSAQFVLDFMRTVPPLAFIPVGLLLLGPTVRMEVTLIVASAVWPVIIQVYFGVRNIDPRLLETARSYNISPIRRILFIVAPAIAPSFATAVRLSATMCLLLAVGTELLATGSGLGFLVGWYQQATLVGEMYVTIAIVGLIGVAINGILNLIEHRALAWHRHEVKTQ